MRPRQASGALAPGGGQLASNVSLPVYSLPWQMVNFLQFRNAQARACPSQGPTSHRVFARNPRTSALGRSAGTSDWARRMAVILTYSASGKCNILHRALHSPQDRAAGFCSRVQRRAPFRRHHRKLVVTGWVVAARESRYLHGRNRHHKSSLTEDRKTIPFSLSLVAVSSPCNTRETREDDGVSQSRRREGEAWSFG